MPSALSERDVPIDGGRTGGSPRSAPLAVAKPAGTSASRHLPVAVSSAHRSRSASIRAASTSLSVSSSIPKAIATRRRSISCIVPTYGVVRRSRFFGCGLRRPTRTLPWPARFPTGGVFHLASGRTLDLIQVYLGGRRAGWSQV
jgi:hypothetical protein